MFLDKNLAGSLKLATDATAELQNVQSTLAGLDADGIHGTVYAKAWEKGTPEPEAWTLEEKVSPVHTQGCPGLFGFTPQNQKRVYIDNILVTPNK